jgi:hypothetical protein
VSVNRKVSSSRSRHPSIVTRATFASETGSTAGAGDVDGDGGATGNVAISVRRSVVSVASVRATVASAFFGAIPGVRPLRNEDDDHHRDRAADGRGDRRLLRPPCRLRRALRGPSRADAASSGSIVSRAFASSLEACSTPNQPTCRRAWAIPSRFGEAGWRGDRGGSKAGARGCPTMSVRC